MNSIKKILLSVLFSTAIFAQENINLVTYGSEALSSEGDDDQKQVIFLKVPASAQNKFYVKIFDPDCFSDFDMSFSNWNTSTKFSLYGDSLAYSGGTVKSAFPDSADLDQGNEIASKVFGQEIEFNADWYTLAEITASQGEIIGDDSYFRLIVEGMEGNDANVYNVIVTDDDFLYSQSLRCELFAFTVSVRLTRYDEYASLRFYPPGQDRQIEVNHFDVGTSKLSLETPFRSIKLPVTRGQGEWVNQRIELEDVEFGKPFEIAFGQGGESPNDATFYVTDQNLVPLPLQLPVKNGIQNSRPTIRKTVTKLSDCLSAVFDASASSDADGENISFTWDFGNGNVKTGERVVYQFPAKETFPVLLIAEDESGTIGNSKYDKFNVTINKQPLPVIKSVDVAAPGGIIEFDASSSTDPDGRIKSYSWQFGEGSTANGVKSNHTYRFPGSYSVQLSVVDDSDSPCNFAFGTKTVKINASPTALAGRDVTTSAGAQVQFDGSASYDPDGKIAKFEWDFGDGSNGSGAKTSHVYSAPGTYTVRLTVTDDDNVSNSKSASELIVSVNYSPKAKAGMDKIVAEGELIVFNALESIDPDGSITDYEWNLGDGSVVKGGYIAHTYPKPGKYTAVLTVKDNSGTQTSIDKDTVVVIVNAAPVAAAGTDKLVTSSVINLDARKSTDSDGTLTNYLWDFGDGTTSTDAAITHVYKAPGVYTVKLTVTDNSGTSNNTSTDEIKVVVNERPIADAGPEIHAVPGDPVKFSGANSFDPDGSISKFVWEFGDGTSAEGISAEHAYAEAGVYTVRLTVTDNTGHSNAVDFNETTVIVNSPPIADAGEDIIAAPDDVLSINGENSSDPDGSIKSYSWVLSTGDAPINRASFRKAITDPGFYTAELTVEDNSNLSNSIAKDVLRIRINNQPVAKAGEDALTCSTIMSFDGSASTDPDGDALSYLWDFGDGTANVNGVNVIHDFVKGGTYPVTLTVSDGLGLKNSISSETIKISINEPPRADAGPDKVICAGDVVIFNGSRSVDPEGGFMIYYWDFGDGTIANGINATKSYPKGGIYQVTLKVEDDSGLPCNTSVDKMVVKVVESPVANAGEDKIVCANSEVDFDGSGSTDFDGVVNSYYWNYGDGASGGGAKPTHIYSKAGTYKVTLTITGDETEGCDNTDTDEITVTVIEAPVAEFLSVDEIPVNEPVGFDASVSSGEGSEITSYKWDFGDGTTSNGVKTSHTFKKFGKFLVKLLIETNSGTDCNFAETRKLITVNGAPTAIAGDDIKSGVNLPVLFNASSSDDPDGSLTAYEWDFGDGTSSQGVNVRHKYQNYGNYTVILKVLDNTSLPNNFDYDTLSISVNEKPAAAIVAVDAACVGEAVNFSGSGSSDIDGNIVLYEWDFGDGTKSTGTDVTHVYKQFGTYDVKLTVQDNSGVANNKTTEAKQIIINSPPVAKMFSLGTLCPGVQTEFDASNTIDIDNKNLKFDWDFGDGNSAEGVIVQHSYDSPGQYRVILTVNDGSGTDCAIETFEQVVRVNSPPVVKYKTTGEFFAGGAHDAILFDATQSYDNDKDALEISWNFGDGTIAGGEKVFHKYIKKGVYKVTISVKDNSGTACGTAEETFSIEIKER